MQFSNSIWATVRRLLKSGMKATEIAKRIPHMRPQDVYNKKRQWSRQEYFDDPKNAIYHTPEYKAWRLAVFRRDGFKCRHCGRKGKNVRLEADHILPKAARPDLIYVVSNGRTLCRSCHRKTPTFGRKAINYKSKI